MVHFHLTAQLWEHERKLGIGYYRDLSMGLLMSPLPVVRIRCHDHYEVLAPCLVHGHCREILAPFSAHSLGSQGPVLEKRPSPSDTAIKATPLKIVSLLNPHLVSGLGRGWGRRVSRPSQAQGIGEDSSQVLRVPVCYGSLPRSRAGGQGEGTERAGLQKGAVSQGLILGSR